MIDGKRIYFGYGNVLVGSTIQGLTFRNVKMPLEIGKTFIDIEKESAVLAKDIECEMEISITSSVNNFLELKNQLLNIHSSSNKIIIFEDYTLDFTKFNQESVDIVLENVSNALFYYRYCTAV